MMSRSIYSGLGRKKDNKRAGDMYTGKWNGVPIEFDRMFRGHRFSDGECEALCRGETIDVHNVGTSDIKYSVAGFLEASPYPGMTPGVSLFRFKADHTISDIVPGADVGSGCAGSKGDEISDEEFIDPFDTNGQNSDFVDMEAQMAAMLEIPLMPIVTKVSNIGEPPVYTASFTLLPDEVLLVAASNADT